MNDENSAPKKIYYVVMQVKSRHPAALACGTTKREFFEAEMDLAWADGMVGCMPVFSDYDLAERYADGQYQIFFVQGETVQ